MPRLHFSIDGQWFTDLVRQMYCFEGKQQAAMDLLENLHGITTTQARNVCTGKARLGNTKDDRISYIEETDEEFVAGYANHLQHVARKIERDDEEAAACIRSLDNPLVFTDSDACVTIGKFVEQTRTNPRREEVLRAGIHIRSPLECKDARRRGETDPGSCAGAIEYAAGIDKTHVCFGGNPPEIDGMIDPRIEQVPGLNKEVTVDGDELLEKLCYCEVCKEHPKDGKNTMFGRRDEYCDLYRERLYATYPVGEPISLHAGDVYPVMGGYIPKKLLDDYSNKIADRLRSLKARPHRADSIRPIYSIDELEEERRALHIAMLSNAGFTPLECGHAATAFKMVIEHFIEERMKRLGLL